MIPSAKEVEHAGKLLSLCFRPRRLVAGDVVWFAPNEKHWHGATPTTVITHIAIHEALDGKTVEWMEHVTAEQYRRS